MQAKFLYRGTFLENALSSVLPSTTYYF